MNVTELSSLSPTPMEKLVFGQNARLHPITKMPLEMGSGCLSDDMQARLVHLPVIARTQGNAAAQATLMQLDAAERQLRAG